LLKTEEATIGGYEELKMLAQDRSSWRQLDGTCRIGRILQRRRSCRTVTGGPESKFC